MSLPRILAAIIALLAAIAVLIAASQTGSLEDLFFEHAALLDQPWGAAALAQVVAGYALMAILIVLVEGSLIKGLIWSAPLILLGNIWAGIYFFLRLPRLIALLKPAPKPSE